MAKTQPEEDTNNKTAPKNIKTQNKEPRKLYGLYQ